MCKAANTNANENDLQKTEDCTTYVVQLPVWNFAGTLATDAKHLQ